ncbi:hypothetical protein XELAEV_18003459mg [Xenopus laevis]|nr:hypothetical protein XELAEV_18003459mg [Xenopus laevis]
MAGCNSLNILIYVLLLCVGPCKSDVLTTNPACRLEMNRPYQNYKYIKDGDITIGGVLTVSNSYEEKTSRIFFKCYE